MDVSRTLAVTLDLPNLLAEIFDELQPWWDIPAPASSSCKARKSSGSTIAGRCRQRSYAARGMPLAEAPTLREVMRQRDVVIIRTCSTIRLPPARSRSESGRTVKQVTAGDRSAVAVPLIVKQRVIGMLRLGHNTPDYYTSEHARLALALADQAAAAIENARLYQEAQRTAALEERQRLARDLHDSVSQSLYGMISGSQTALERLDRGADG